MKTEGRATPFTRRTEMTTWIGSRAVIPASVVAAEGHSLSVVRAGVVAGLDGALLALSVQAVVSAMEMTQTRIPSGHVREGSPRSVGVFRQKPGKPAERAVAAGLCREPLRLPVRSQ
eukprot:16418701-Heterocapsa_arctica.AAC.1